MERQDDRSTSSSSSSSTTTSTVLDSVGGQVVELVVPVSACMLLVVFLVNTIHPRFGTPDDSPNVQSVVTLVYSEKATDPTSRKLEGAVLNSLVFVTIITGITFLLVLLYYYRCIKFLKWYMCASAALVLAYMGGTVFVQLIRLWSIPVDTITFSIFLLNFTILGVLAVFLKGLPILLTQFYLVMIGVLVAFWFTMLPEWTTWVLLLAMAAYDLVAVLAPAGPLNLLVQLAMSRDEEIPALIYEGRPVSVSQRVAGTSAPVSSAQDPTSSTSAAAFTPSSSNRGPRRWRHRHNFRLVVESSTTPSTELQPLNLRSRLQIGMIRGGDNTSGTSLANSSRNEDQQDGMPRNLQGASALHTPHVHNASALSTDDASAVYEDLHGNALLEDEETMPLVNHPTQSASVVATAERIESVEVQEHRSEVSEEQSEGRIGLSATGAIKLGLGDFVFYSVLVGRAAMYDLMTVYACYLAIIAGLGSTLILLAVARRALPALPIAICLGVIFYFLTRLLMEPLIVLLSTNLLMF